MSYVCSMAYFMPLISVEIVDLLLACILFAKRVIIDVFLESAGLVPSLHQGDLYWEKLKIIMNQFKFICH